MVGGFESLFSLDAFSFLSSKTFNFCWSSPEEVREFGVLPTSSPNEVPAKNTSLTQWVNEPILSIKLIAEFPMIITFCPTKEGHHFFEKSRGRTTRHHRSEQAP